MIDSAYRATLFALYQFSIALGIALLPLAVAVSQLGLTLPVHRVVEGIEHRYERAQVR